MPQKIFDILPPKPPTTFREEKKPLVSKKVSLPKSFEKKRWRKWWGVIPLALILIGAFCYFTLSKAEIEIWPETELLTFEGKATIGREVDSVDILKKVIPGKIISAEKTVSGEFQSSGKILKEKKAEGTIRIYNNYYLAQTLVANTRFQPPLEKFQPPLEKGENPWFLISEKITIPSKSYKDAKVIAANPGEKYNIPPSKFSIPGLAGTAQYALVYGESFEPMKGGYKSEVPQVTQEDLKEAQKTLEERALRDSEAALKEKISPEIVLLEGAQVSEILETFSLARPKEELEKFSFQVKAKSEALVFNTRDMENFVRDFILSQIADGKKFHQESLKTNYFPETIDLKAGKIFLSLKAEAKIYSDIDESNLKKNLSGKSLAEVKIFLENQPKITKAQVRFWPFWVKKVPQDIEKIDIRLRID